MDSKFNSVFGNVSTKAENKAKAEQAEKLLRKEKSLWHFKIPDWLGEGGTREFWMNSDGTYESEDNRIDDTKIRDGIRAFANNWA